MKFLVCISNVPDTTTKITFTPDNKEFNKAGVQFVINPWDEYALTRAIELKEAQGSGTVTVLNVGEADTEPNIRKALAIGADDAIRVNAAPKDAYFVAQQIAHYAKEGGYDVILMGKESIDYNGFQVHGMVGELLGIPTVAPAMKLDMNGNTATLEREIEGGKEIVEVNAPFVASCQQPMCEPRIPNMRGIMTARTKPLKVVDAVGEGAATEVAEYQLPPKKQGVKLIPAEQAGELIKLLRNEAKVI
ncbi:electron transfer flavoprotein subunit beta/FixA family protein [Hymenobacter busanensis]|uniref:Electron transfer flavoprotein subunit beta n=1 Tax=Hymenobacter busanensis TaxID=2607656 RepID=A0A7L4ZZC6_9BACT|nr:electron transfer flavoprotein subunit beta/FixA family protein [Hymenobacter busanensis]KAA9339410.1 electron transfer flavoprotein subunit beta/FixA family protein [Hymenobacter busanensis]QHJ06830.1 electron transfer flavoprotein beta subunit/FixA family protein [Hymenobacter busanensis]